MQVLKIDDVQVLRTKLLDNADILECCGYTRPIFRTNLEDVPELIQAITLHYVILHSKAELDQLKEGLQTCKVLKFMKEFPGIFKDFFSKQAVVRHTAGKL